MGESLDGRNFSIKKTFVLQLREKYFDRNFAVHFQLNGSINNGAAAAP